MSICKKLFASPVGKESACSAGDLGSIPGLGRSPGEGKGYPLQYSGLENSMDCILHGVARSQTRLSDFHFQFHPGPETRSCTLKLKTLHAAMKMVLQLRPRAVK